MSHINVCRLCLNVCNDCKRLYCASGQTNETYDITVKYFHTMFINVDQKNQNTVMCLECWHHISDFHNYQQSIFEAQRKLLQVKSFMEYQCSIQSTRLGENKSCSIPIKEEAEDSMTDYKFMDEFSYCNTLGTVKNEDDSNNKLAYNPKDSANVATIHNGLHNGNEEDPFIRNVYSSEHSENFGTIHDRLHNGNEEDPEIRISNNRKDSANVATIDNKLYNANEEEPSTRNAYNPKDSAKIGTINTGLYNIEYKCIDGPEELNEQSNFADCLSLGGKRKHSNSNLQIKPRESKRSKTQSEPNGSVSKGSKNFECGRCGVLVTSFDLLQCHFRQEHPTEECHIAVHKFPKVERNALKCSKCDLKLSGTVRLYNHKRKCLGNNKARQKPIRRKGYLKATTEEIEEFIAVCKPNLECVVCHKTCQRFTQLQWHFRDEHPDDVFYVMCCQREFNKRSLFKEHVWLHVDPNAFKCSICGKNNSTYYGLQGHMLNIHATILEPKSVEDIQRSLNSILENLAN